MTKEFNLHDMNFLHRYPRDFGPSLVGVGVVVKDCNEMSADKRGEGVRA